MTAFNGSAPPAAATVESRADVLALALEQAGHEVRPTDSGFMSQCPGHDDRRPSLSIDTGEDGRALVYCFAGCAAVEAVSPIGWALRDLFANSKTRSAKAGTRVRVKVKPPEPLGPGHVAEVDAYHVALFEVARDVDVRHTPLVLLQRKRGISREVAKSARLGWDAQRRAYTIPQFRDGQLVAIERYKLPADRRDGEHGLRVEKGATRWLFQPQPEREDELVIVCEGSMDALAVQSATGLRTVAVPSASVCRDEWGAELHASGVRRAVIAFDADEAGRKGAETAACSLRLAGIAAWPIDLAPERDDGYDLTDFVLEHGGDALRALLFESGDSLLDSLRAYFGRYIVVSAAILDVLAVWAVHTHAVDAFDASPYLNVNSAEKGSGKTRVLEALELVVAKPWLTGRATAAVLPRKIDADRPTLLLDESDNAFSGDRDYAAALVGILNTGYKPSGKTSLCVGKDHELRDFSTFCPKAFAGIGSKQLPDTVADRSIPLRIERFTREEREHVERFREREARTVAEPLRAACERWAAQHFDQLHDARPDIPDCFDGRAADIAEPLLAVADRAGGEWPQRVREALLRLLTGDERPDAASDGTRLLADVRTAWPPDGEGVPLDKVPSVVLVHCLTNMSESRWADMGYGRQLTAAGLARRLGEYGIHSRTVRTGTGTLKGYLRESFEDAWKRYLPAPPDSERHNVTNGAQSQKSPESSVTQPHLVTAEDPPNLAVQADCDVVTAGSGGSAVTHASSGPAAPVNVRAFGEPYRPALASSNGNGNGREATT